MAQEKKFFLQSKTMWGIAIMALPTVFKAVGYDMSSEEAGEFAGVLQYLIEGVGALLAIIGRMKARGAIVASPGKANV